MNDFLKDNINKFDNVEDCDYFFDKDHQLRGDISIELLKSIINKKSEYPQKLLSIACSTGVIEEKMKNKLGIIVFGIDAAKNSLKTASKRGIITKYADFSKPLPFRNNYFDFVFAGEIIEHVFDTKSFLLEIYRVLKPKGYLILTTPNLARLDDRLKLLFGKTPRQTSPLHPYLYLHIHPFTFDSLKNALETCGFTEIALRTNAFVIDFWSREIIFYSKFFALLFPTLGATLIVRAKKEINNSRRYKKY